MTAVAVSELHKSYGDFEAVRGVSFEIQVGEVFGLLGPNGAGKTTTVEILEGYRKRDRGDVSVLGTDPEHARLDWRERIGVVLQHDELYWTFTVRECVELFAGYYERPRDPGEVVRLVGLEQKADARVKTLSGGQKRRLDLAVALVGDPELLFLDEPTTGFDPEARRHFWSLIRSLQELGTTMLLTTHYLDEAETLADRVGVIARGRLVEVAVPAALGGRESAPVVVSWTEGDARRSEATQTPTALVQELAARLGGEVPELSVARPTLEDVYLRMIGEPS
ncbi:MAG: ABC transporter ATP-binding protein [Gaiellaceae bacterium]